MVSQSLGWQDSPVDLWEGVSGNCGNIEGLPSLLDSHHLPCQSDVRFTRHRAAWINPPCVQQRLQDLPLQVPAMGNSGSHFVGGSPSPLGPSPLSLEDSEIKTILSKDTAGSIGSSGKKNDYFSFTSTQERAMLPGHSPRMSLFTSSKILAAYPYSEANSACFKPSHLTASTGEDNCRRGLLSFLSFHTLACLGLKSKACLTVFLMRKMVMAFHFDQ